MANFWDFYMVYKTDFLSSSFVLKQKNQKFKAWKLRLKNF